jgi:hypothetical protein
MPYPCAGYCIIDARGYCVACGRPPTLGAPEVYETARGSKAGKSVAAASPAPLPDADDAGAPSGRPR